MFVMLSERLKIWKMNYPKISSPRCDVVWAGWRSDTFTLQQAGWQFSAEQDIAAMRFRFAIKHPNYRIYGLSQLVDFAEYQEFYGNHRFDRPAPLVINHMVSRAESRLIDDLSKFNPVDCEPQLNMESKIKSIEDFMIFRPIDKAKEIIVPDFQINDLLKMIIEKQDPKQAEIREKKRKEWRKFQREINEAQTINVEEVIDNRSDIVAQLVCVR